MINDKLAWLWDWSKRIFGRSKIIFTNIVGVVLTGWVELYDPISMFDWDTVTDKHELAVMIGIGVSVLNVVLRSFASNGPADFKALPTQDDIEPDEDSLELSPKAH